MTSKFYLDGYNKTLQNASDLLEIASKSGELKKYGIGVSLSILSAEESIKALFIIQQSVSPLEKVSDFDKIFRNHKVKHKYILEFLRVIMTHIYDILDEYDTHFKTRKDRRGFKRKNPKIAARIDWFKKNQKFSDEMYPLIEWLDKANSQKNNGLYVDMNEGEWKLPNQTSEVQYKKSIKNAQDIYKYVKFSEIVLTKTEFNS